MNLDELLHALQSEIGLRTFAYENLKLYQRLGESAVKLGDRYRADLQLQNVKDQCKKIAAIEAEIGRLCAEVAQLPNSAAADWRALGLGHREKIEADAKAYAAKLAGKESK